MDRIHKLLGVGAIAALAIGIAPNARARSITAWGGKPQSYQEATCFSEWYATATNNCATEEVWEVPLFTDTPGTWTVTVNVTPTSDTTSVSCMAFGTQQDAGDPSATAYTTAQVFATQASVPQNLSLSTYLPMDGALYVACWLKQGGRVNTVNWNPGCPAGLVSAATSTGGIACLSACGMVGQLPCSSGGCTESGYEERGVCEWNPDCGHVGQGCCAAGNAFQTPNGTGVYNQVGATQDVCVDGSECSWFPNWVCHTPSGGSGSSSSGGGSSCGELDESPCGDGCNSGLCEDVGGTTCVLPDCVNDSPLSSCYQTYCE